MLSIFSKYFWSDGVLSEFFYSMLAMIRTIFSPNPAGDLLVIGVTGSKGKTTTAVLIESGLRFTGLRVALYTPDILQIDGKTLSTHPDIWEFLILAQKSWCTHIILTVSYHDLIQYRFHGLRYDIAVLTNIFSDDSSTYGAWVEKYASVFLRVFQWLYKYGVRRGIRKVSIVNQDSDGSSLFLTKDVVTDTQYVYGLSTVAQIRAENIIDRSDGLSLDVVIPSNRFSLKSPLHGNYNVSNMLAAVSVLMSQQIGIEVIQQAFAQSSTLRGRLEPIPNTRGVTIFLDRADTVETIDRVLQTIEGIEGRNRTVVLFGISTHYTSEILTRIGKTLDNGSDILLLTENISSSLEISPALISLSLGINRKEGKDFWVVASRDDAIRTAIIMLTPGDVLLIAGESTADASDAHMIEQILMEIDSQIIL